MMYQTFGLHTPGSLPGHHVHDAFLDHLSTQMALPQATRRLSRSSLNGKQRAGSAMRVVKPSSANNSPRSSGMLNRRTMVDGSNTRRLPYQAMDYHLPIPQGNDLSRRKQTVRPPSWHPSPYVQQVPTQRQQPVSYNLPNPSVYGDHDLYSAQPQFSPVMASYSTDTSPCSTFSPLPLFPGSDNAQYVPTDAWHLSQRTPFYPPSHDSQGLPESLVTVGGVSQRTPAAGALDWNTFIPQGFNNTSLPTPGSFLPLQHPQPAMTEAAVPCEALDETEGEILVGMGLYDAPEKCDEDPHLDNYRSTVSSLLRSSLRPHEPWGKGLKLEETWEPPKSDG